MENELDSVEQAMRTIVERAGRRFPQVSGALPIYDVVSYHLGWKDERFSPSRVPAGKRFRPLLCLRACSAVGGDPTVAAWIAAAIELLHNFTLIHDDIQDRSLTRRHRPTVWALWGKAQAINAGDALFALSQLAALEGARTLDPERGRLLLTEFNETTLRIVEGQVLDLSFEQRSEITTTEYFTMIERKTAALVAFAAWAGTVVAGASLDMAGEFADFGRILGLGFQVQDDYLGVWGEPTVTGKSRGDDLRQRKKSLPILLLLERARSEDRAWVQEVWSTRSELDPPLVDRILSLLEEYQVDRAVREVVEQYHAQAHERLDILEREGASTAELRELVERLRTREG